MCRFSVLVVGPDSLNSLEDVLQPYNESIEFPPYIKFTREDKKAEKKQVLANIKKQFNASQSHPLSPHMFAKLMEEYKHFQHMSDEEYFRDATKYYDPSTLTATGEPISIYNPNTKWNRWEYDKELASKHEFFVGSARKSQINWSFMQRMSKNRAWIKWAEVFNPAFGTPTTSDKLRIDYWDGETKEQYIERQQLFMTHAYILRGKWYERGNIGWWSEDKMREQADRDKWIAQYKKMLTQVKPHTVLTTIECSI